MSKGPTYKELECKVKELEIEREFLQKAISAASYPYCAIYTNCYKILVANAALIAFYEDHFITPICYSWTHKRSTPYTGEEHPCPLKIADQQNHRLCRNTPTPIVIGESNF